jgi:uncharacterized protein (TIGR02453 family)
MPKQSTLDFLSQLDQNNNKVWFDEHRKHYEAAKADFEGFIGDLLQAATATVPELEGRKAKDCIFRIYKDVRFSKDKVPYKNNFGAGFGKGDKKMNVAGFYVHLQPGNHSFIGGGLWMPEAALLKAVRQEIDYDLDSFTAILKKASFKKLFGEPDQSEKLKRAPKDYEEDNPAIEYLKLKSFTVGTSFSDKDMVTKDAVGKIAAIVKEMKPFIDFLNKAIS